MSSIRPFVYVAGPYRDDNAAVRAARIVAHQRAACALARAGLVPYAPIAHWAPMAAIWLPSEIESSFDFWMNQDLPILAKAEALVLLPLRGWDTSRGTAAELGFAEANNIPIWVLDPVPWKGSDIVGTRPGFIGWKRLSLSEHSFFVE